MRRYGHILGGVLAVLITVAFARPLAAQRAGDWSVVTSYSTVLGVGETRDFIGGFSWRGVTMDSERWFGQNFTAGWSAGWHVLSSGGEGTSEFDGGAATGAASRFLNAVPILLKGTYFFGQAGTDRPFLGAGGGTYWIENRTEAGIFAVTESNWHVGLMAEVGLARRTNGRTTTLSARYNWALRTNEIEHSYLTFSVGFGM